MVSFGKVNDTVRRQLYVTAVNIVVVYDEERMRKPRRVKLHISRMDYNNGP